MHSFGSWLQIALTVLCGVALLMGMAGLHPGFPLLAVGFGAPFAIRSAIQSLADRQVDVNFLMVLAAVGAVVLGHSFEAAVLLFLFSLSSTLESYAMARTKSAIEGLIQLRPEKARRIDPEGDRMVELAELQLGDRVRVLPFEQIPCDGLVLEGSSSVDQHAMTGESTPVPRQPGERVLAGTQNLEGMLVVEVGAVVGDTTLERIVRLVRDAQENKASGERISQWFGQSYTFIVIGLFGLAWIGRLAWGQPMDVAAYGALTLLVALSPCALVISTPASTLSALAYAARRGILVRGGEYIERAGTIDWVALDKTGTLTKGRPVLSEICVCHAAPVLVPGGGEMCLEEEACWKGGEMSPEAREMLRLAAAAEQYSTHPIAQEIVAAARMQGVDVPEAIEAQAHSGLGVTAVVEGRPVAIGQRRFFEDDSRRLDPHFAMHAEELQRKGMTVAILQAGERWAALGLRDAPRDDAQPMVEALRRLGVRSVVMVTGDNVETARAIAEDVGIEEVHAGLLPEDKTAILIGRQAEGRRTMMVGDGINDAPSLASSSVGVAMGGLGSDIALDAAHVVLMEDRLMRIPELIRLGRMANRIIRANLVFAGSVILLLTLGSFALEWVAPNMRTQTLPFAVVGHEGSTVLVILNGLRLLRGPKGV